MRKSKIRRQLILSLVAMMLCFTNMMRLTNHSQVRAIEVCTFIAFGMALGAFIMAAIAFFRARRAGEVV